MVIKGCWIHGTPLPKFLVSSHHRRSRLTLGGIWTLFSNPLGDLSQDERIQLWRDLEWFWHQETAGILAVICPKSFIAVRIETYGFFLNDNTRCLMLSFLSCGREEIWRHESKITPKNFIWVRGERLDF
ncbi:hypothetical protein GDO81_024344 [Engystomops pustulosus]|uniref:Uncharacterized protein n=1 Tax=Engystomops pustulosus TaxID=76066 RepID=A0AAV6YU71_ENGPU|nr:hypothetical protein GDO81_024344 [Engystomops pustulosus]